MNSPKTGQNHVPMLAAVIISVAVAGYFIGLQSPMNRDAASVLEKKDQSNQSSSTPAHLITDANQLPAQSYSEMNQMSRQGSRFPRTTLAELKTSVDPLAEISITEQQKSFALARRDQNRAFNGAPPTIPHPIDQLSTQACIVCHGEGVKTETLRISKMSHQFLHHCTQCHVEQNRQHIASSAPVNNSFVGLPAPSAGERAYTGAPPTIPHSTWMRVECMSCHGVNGLHGIRSTHPWRQNCLQCHAPSSQLEQSGMIAEPKFLPPPEISQ